MSRQRTNRSRRPGRWFTTQPNVWIVQRLSVVTSAPLSIGGDRRDSPSGSVFLGSIACIISGLQTSKENTVRDQIVTQDTIPLGHDTSGVANTVEVASHCD